LHVWVFFADATHISLPSRLKIKSFLKLLSANLGLSVGGTAMYVVAVERFIEHKN